MKEVVQKVPGELVGLGTGLRWVASTRGLAEAVHGGGQVPHGEAAVGLAGEQVAPGPRTEPPGALTLEHREGGGGRAVHRAHRAHPEREGRGSPWPQQRLAWPSSPPHTLPGPQSPSLWLSFLPLHPQASSPFPSLPSWVPVPGGQRASLMSPYLHTHHASCHLSHGPLPAALSPWSSPALSGQEPVQPPPWALGLLANLQPTPFTVALAPNTHRTVSAPSFD